MNENSLYKKFHNKIFVYLKRHVSDEDAEELAQDVFVKATKNLERFRGESSHQTWLYRIATNCLKDFYKSRSMREKGLIEEAELESFPVDELSPEDEQLTVEMNACISEFIHRLPENYAAVLALHELEGFKIKEIAEVIEAEPGTVKVRLHRARAKLKQEMEQGCVVTEGAHGLICERKPD